MIDDKIQSLEEFIPLNVMTSFEEKTMRASTFTLVDTYFVLFSDFLTTTENKFLDIFQYFEIRVSVESFLFRPLYVLENKYSSTKRVVSLSRKDM